MTPDQLTDKIVSPLSDAHPLLGVIAAIIIIGAIGLTIVVRYLVKQLETKDKELAEIQEYIREQDKENLRVLSNLDHAITEIARTNDHIEHRIEKQIDGLKNHLINRTGRGN